MTNFNHLAFKILHFLFFQNIIVSAISKSNILVSWQYCVKTSLFLPALSQTSLFPGSAVSKHYCFCHTKSNILVSWQCCVKTSLFLPALSQTSLFPDSTVSKHLCFLTALSQNICVSWQLSVKTSVFPDSSQSKHLRFLTERFQNSNVSKQLCFRQALCRNSFFPGL